MSGSCLAGSIDFTKALGNGIRGILSGKRHVGAGDAPGCILAGCPLEPKLLGTLGTLGH